MLDIYQEAATLPLVSSIEKRQYKTKTVWVVRYRVNGQSRSRTFEKERDAKAFVTATDHSTMSGTAVDPVLGRTTLGQFWDEWIEGQPLRPTTRSTYNQSRRYIGDLADVPLAKIRPMDIEKVLAGLDLADSTKRLAFVRLRTVLNAAVRNGYIAQNPAQRAKAPRRPSPEAAVSLSDEDVRRILHKMTSNVEAAVLAGVSGMRVGEIAGLRVRDLDPENGLIHVEVQRDGAPLKTESSRRSIPVGEGVMVAVALLAEGKRGDDHLFNRAKTISHSFREGAKAAGVDATIHDLRGYAASRWIRQGLSVIEVQRLLGHGNATTTLQVYAREWADQSARQREATQQIGEVLGFGLQTLR
jgi:integrase